MADRDAAKVVLGVGTTNGGYLFRSDESREHWKPVRHFLRNESVNSVTFDPENRRLYAATHTEGVFVSEDMGRSWSPSSRGLHVRKAWTLAIDPNDSSTLYAGTHYGHLFKSSNKGKFWEEVTGLHEAPKRKKWGIDWAFGTTGLCIHTVLVDPRDSNRIYIIASGNGAYRSDDGGKTWEMLRNGIVGACPIFAGRGAPRMPNQETDAKLEEHLNGVHVCAHKIVLSKKNPDVLYQQNHCGVYVSKNRGEKWEDISPSKSQRHGFAISSVENGAETVFTVPAYQGTCKKHNSCIQGQLAVYRGRNGGKTWGRLENGLRNNVHNCILRDAMAVDSFKDQGVYFGTTTGEVYGSIDQGRNWMTIARTGERIQGLSSFSA